MAYNKETEAGNKLSCTLKKHEVTALNKNINFWQPVFLLYQQLITATTVVTIIFQSIISARAGLITGEKKFGYLIYGLKELHWLKIYGRIEFEILQQFYKFWSITTTTPPSLLLLPPPHHHITTTTPPSLPPPHHPHHHTTISPLPHHHHYHHHTTLTTSFV